MPTTTPITLKTIDILKTSNFLDKKEMSIYNIGGNESVVVKGITCKLKTGIMELKSRSIWNTIPNQVHDIRIKFYFYMYIP